MTNRARYLTRLTCRTASNPAKSHPDIHRRLRPTRHLIGPMPFQQPECLVPAQPNPSPRPSHVVPQRLSRHLNRPVMSTFHIPTSSPHLPFSISAAFPAPSHSLSVALRLQYFHWLNCCWHLSSVPSFISRSSSPMRFISHLNESHALYQYKSLLAIAVLSFRPRPTIHRI